MQAPDLNSNLRRRMRLHICSSHQTYQTVRLSAFSGRRLYEVDSELTYSRRNYEEVLDQLVAHAAEYELEDERRNQNSP
jgi:hypothetical protein